MMYSCNDSNDLLHTFLTLICPSAYYMLYCNMSIHCNTLGAIYRYGKIQYRHSSNGYWEVFITTGVFMTAKMIFTQIFEVYMWSQKRRRTGRRVVLNCMITTSLVPVLKLH